MENGITKKDSKFLYGVAIILMIYHHLFCIPSRLQYPYFSVLDNLFGFTNVSVERPLAWFCKICVAIFAFITGYGMARSLNNVIEHKVFKNLFLDYKNVVIRILKLILKIFLVLSVFTPLFILLKDGKVTFLEYVSNVFTLSFSFCGEYWYAAFYTKILLLLPLFNLIFACKSKNPLVRTLCIVIPLAIIVCTYMFCPKAPDYIYAIILAEGFLISRFKVFEKVSKYTKGTFGFVLSLIVLLLVIVLRIYASNEAGYNYLDIFIAAPFVYSILIIFNKAKHLYKGVCFLGGNSTYMWLTHTLIAYILFPRFTTISGISTVIFIQLVVVSLLLSFGFGFVERFIYFLLNKTKSVLLFRKKA